METIPADIFRGTDVALGLALVEACKRFLDANADVAPSAQYAVMATHMIETLWQMLDVPASHRETIFRQGIDGTITHVVAGHGVATIN